MSFSSLLLLIPRAWSRRARPAAQATATPGPRAPQVRRGGAPAQAEGGCRSRLGTASGTGRGTWHCRRARRPGRRSRETFSLEVPRARPTPGATRGHGWPPTASAPPVEEPRVPSRRSAGAGKGREKMMRKRRSKRRGNHRLKGTRHRRVKSRAFCRCHVFWLGGKASCDVSASAYDSA